MSHDEFWRLTPAELNELIEGYGARRKDTRDLLAWHAANIMNASGNMKRAVKLNDLVGDEPDEDTRKTREQARREWLELKRMFGE